MEIRKILHILRNPHGWSEEEKKQARLGAADEIQRWQIWGRNILKWAEEHGLDIVAYNQAHEAGVGDVIRGSDLERVSAEVVLIDGRHYRRMTDEEGAGYIWGGIAAASDRDSEAVAVAKV